MKTRPLPVDYHSPVISSAIQMRPQTSSANHITRQSTSTANQIEAAEFDTPTKTHSRRLYVTEDYI